MLAMSSPFSRVNRSDSVVVADNCSAPGSLGGPGGAVGLGFANVSVSSDLCGHWLYQLRTHMQ